MHPARSVILFTSLSGIGFGFLIWLGLGIPKAVGGVGAVYYALAFVLTAGGLIASTFHLGNPQRAWRAFTQWRTSWLSREAVLAVLALAIMALHGAAAVFLGYQPAFLGLLGAALCLATVLATAMIYTQLKTVPRWNQPSTPILFALLSLAGGALLAGRMDPALWLLIAAGAVQLWAWLQGDKAFAENATTLATATRIGEEVRAFEPPHTGGNYLMREMVFQVGRKHALKLRAIAFALMIALPVLIILVNDKHLMVSIAVLLHFAGVLVARWLFFAEAEHVVGLYYGRPQTPLSAE
ncbi:dimethyl sulfoxide reductase anchor subunit [Dinoroseobacter sp. PD6]|nr:DmsC/YnfH family molybdoenzyme membrane anchor subunit [Dinoroseobacter sp. PD6]MDD9716079.1 dimethyl sulfoxide reductase anchor subunit [Dinoroseobacter sp. PD6]